MTINELAKEITKREGLKKEINITQVKEILRVLAEIFAKEYKSNKADSWGAFRRYALTKVKNV